MDTTRFNPIRTPTGPDEDGDFVGRTWRFAILSIIPTRDLPAAHPRIAKGHSKHSSE